MLIELKPHVHDQYRDRAVLNVHNYFLQVDHFQEQLKQKALFGEKACSDAGPLAAYLLLLYFSIVTKCIQKHSSRPHSDEVYILVVVFLQIIIVIFYIIRL